MGSTARRRGEKWSPSFAMTPTSAAAIPVRLNSAIAAAHIPMFMNEGTFKMFRPDLENPGPDDVSNAILFLVSDEARYITGVTLSIDAGALIK
jgi:(+)-trans-carveol dehydrogenase